MSAINPDSISQLDETTYEILFRAYYAGLCGYARKYVAESEVAEEIVQDIFVLLWEKRETLAIKSSFKSYLFRAVNNKCLNYLKHQQVRNTYQAHAQQADPVHAAPSDDLLAAQELEHKILATLSSLPKQRRKIFQMSRYEGLKYREIAEKLNLSPKTVEVQMGKALKTLRNALKDYLYSFLFF